MLQLIDVNKSFNAQPVLDEVSFVVNRGEHIALVGANGSGKSTLLRIIAGLEEPDTGVVRLDRSITIGYLPQGLEPKMGGTVEAVILSGLATLESLRRELELLSRELAQSPSSPRLLSQYGETEARFEAMGGYAIEQRMKVVLDGLGLGDIDVATRVDRLSGGQKTRLGLARLLLSEPELMLLDEPTNHLDIDALEWFEGFLNDYKGAALIVSHDRTFLDRTVSQVIELDQDTHRTQVYAGSFTDYQAAKTRALEKQWATWKDQQAEIRRIESDIRRTKEQARHTEQGTDNDHYRRLAKKVAQKAKARENRLQRYIDAEDRVERPVANWRMKLEFGEMPRGGQVVLTLEGLGHRYGDRWLFREVGQTLQHKERIALLGPNGAGKTTLLRIIAGQLAPSEGQVRLGSGVRLGYMPQEQESLDPKATSLDLIRDLAPLAETEARHLLHFFLFEGDQVFLPVGQLSYGERARLLLARLVVGKANLLVLDEPINHLDIPSRERFESALGAFPGTILISTHDRNLIDRFATAIWSIEDGALRRYPDRLSLRKSRMRAAR